uniref:Uncharacterized protein n=1 Tax=Romanomermis culicivorax TaxID=13658 RepID=A0A915II66_ROMCU
MQENDKVESHKPRTPDEAHQQCGLMPDHSCQVCRKTPNERTAEHFKLLVIYSVKKSNPTFEKEEDDLSMEKSIYLDDSKFQSENYCIK